MKTKAASHQPRIGRKRIYIVEDHPIFREGIMRAIDSEADMAVCGFADSASKALTAITDLKPDLALIDVGLPGRSGLELIKDLRAACADTPLLVVSMHDEFLFAERALRAGARGYVMKHENTATVLKAIRHVLSGGVFVSPNMSERILRTFSAHPSKEPRTSFEQLTDREFEVLRLVGRGLGTSEIASQLHLSPKTVAVHKTRIKEKLKLKTTTEMVRFAVTCETPQMFESE